MCIQRRETSCYITYESILSFCNRSVSSRHTTVTVYFSESRFESLAGLNFFPSLPNATIFTHLSVWPLCSFYAQSHSIMREEHAPHTLAVVLKAA